MQGVKISNLKPTSTLNSNDQLIVWRPGLGNGNTYKIPGSIFGKSSEITALKLRAQDLESRATALQNGKVSKSGDSMSGKLTLNGNPTEPLHAVTKQYVDSKTDTATAAKTWAQLKCS